MSYENPRTSIVINEKPSEDDDAAQTNSIQTSSKSLRVQSLAEYSQHRENLSLDWIVKNFIPRGYLIVLAGTSKAGKSTLLTALAMAAVQGIPFMDLENVKTNVLWWAFEESPRERMQILGLHWGPEEDPPPGFYMTHERLPVDSKEGLNALSETIRQKDIGLVIIDPLYAALDCGDLSGGSAARKSLTGLKDLCNDLNVTVILIHHFNKGREAGNRNRIADSNQIPAACSMDILMESSSIGGHRLITLTCAGRGDFANVRIELRSENSTSFKLESKSNSAMSMPEVRFEKVQELLKASKSGMTARELHAQMPAIKIGTLKNLLTEWSRDHKINASTSGKEHLYQYASEECDSENDK
jgi:archaellum biogenesis ATPase FlaH